MITLKSPPYQAVRVLHLNKASSSPGGKDYVLVQMNNGELWAVNGPSQNIRSGGGAIQHPKKSWREMVNEKSNKGYQIVGEYSQGSWWPAAGNVYLDVPNIPLTQQAVPPPQPDPEPEPPKPAGVRVQQQSSSLAEQYPVSDLVRKAFGNTTAGNEWFCII